LRHRLGIPAPWHQPVPLLSLFALQAALKAEHEIACIPLNVLEFRLDLPHRALSPAARAAERRDWRRVAGADGIAAPAAAWRARLTVHYQLTWSSAFGAVTAVLFALLVALLLVAFSFALLLLLLLFLRLPSAFESVFAPPQLPQSGHDKVVFATGFGLDAHPPPLQRLCPLPPAAIAPLLRHLGLQTGHHLLGRDGLVDHHSIALQVQAAGVLLQLGPLPRDGALGAPRHSFRGRRAPLLAVLPHQLGQLELLAVRPATKRLVARAYRQPVAPVDRRRPPAASRTP